MQQQSLRFLTTVPTDAEETELAGIREMGRYSVGNMEYEEEILFLTFPNSSKGDP